MKNKSYDKATFRITTILSELMSGETISVKELAEQFNVSIRTVQKDINERLANKPIKNLGNGKYTLDKEMIVDPIVKTVFLRFLSPVKLQFCSPVYMPT